MSVGVYKCQWPTPVPAISLSVSPPLPHLQYYAWHLVYYCVQVAWLKAGTVAKMTDNRPITGHTTSSLLPTVAIVCMQWSVFELRQCPSSQGNKSKCWEWLSRHGRGSPVVGCSLLWSPYILLPTVLSVCFSLIRGNLSTEVLLCLARESKKGGTQWLAAATSVQRPPSPLLCSFCV